jgi:hypothetical protein
LKMRNGTSASWVFLDFSFWYIIWQFCLPSFLIYDYIIPAAILKSILVSVGFRIASVCLCGLK